MRQWIANAVYTAIFAILIVRIGCWLLHFCDVWVKHPWDMIAFVVLYLSMVIPETIYMYKHRHKGQGNNDLFPGM